MSGEEALSHEEVWDDSALIDSWNQALDEYTKYHSIIAKGGSIKDLEDAVLSSSTAATNKVNGSTKTADREAVEVTDEPTEEAEPTEGLPSAPPGPPPQVLLGTVQDEGLKKLLMAWYYAGYYTGLFEGQQKKTEEKR
ncbi:Survival motor neuron protein (SMN) [Geosmithia morbida]|uniref:Survival motor neuron protein (SMN) n=1 Tax=Geosmithia morbida TaxID=1094350 RepID=A0A9P4YPI6_9HYPO|nr:Survival motor neuron protein (SMN) [Geosmithia morbida]KAF4119424.1 Survival motor neuron protein (SMN) [Geosmithia morbida]